MSVPEHGDSELSSSPRIVLRGVKNQLASLGNDSLYLVLEYPRPDIFNYWSLATSDLNDPALFAGIPMDEFLVRRGGNGYKLSVWDGDARLYMTDRVNDKLNGTASQGQGMGLMLQLGPKWLVQFGQAFAPNTLRKNVAEQLSLFGVKNPEQYPIRINRLDIALDVLNLDISRFSVDEWRNGWVGYAKPHSVHFDKVTGQLTGFSVGSYKGNVRFKGYNKVVESLKDGDSDFWRSVWGVEELDPLTVTRFEWSIRCYSGRFKGLRYLSNYTYEGFLGVLNYVSEKWGRLCIPGDDPRHKSRWQVSPLWQELRGFINEWSLNYDQYVRPEYDLKPDIKPGYKNFVAGTLAGLQARLGIEQGKGGPASMAQSLSYLSSEGHSMDDIAAKAQEKYEVFSRLSGEHEE